MSDTPSNGTESHLFYGLGVRVGDQFRLIEDPETESLKDGENPSLAVEMPPTIAYEVAYALSVYGKTLNEFAEEEDNEGVAGTLTARGQFALELGGLIHDLCQSAFKLIGQEGSWNDIDFSAKFVEEENDAVEGAPTDESEEA